MFYAAKHKSIHLQWRNVGQTRRMQDGVPVRTAPIRPCQEPHGDKVPVCCAESKTWPEAKGGVTGGRKVLSNEKTEFFPELAPA